MILSTTPTSHVLKGKHLLAQLDRVLLFCLITFRLFNTWSVALAHSQLTITLKSQGKQLSPLTVSQKA